MGLMGAMGFSIFLLRWWALAGAICFDGDYRANVGYRLFYFCKIVGAGGSLRSLRLQRGGVVPEWGILGCEIMKL